MLQLGEMELFMKGLQQIIIFIINLSASYFLY